MSDRLSRQRTATKPFEYRQPSAFLPDNRGTSAGDIDNNDGTNDLGVADKGTQLIRNLTHGKERAKKRDYGVDFEVPSLSQKRARRTTEKKQEITGISSTSDTTNNDSSKETDGDVSSSEVDTESTELTKLSTPYQRAPWRAAVQTSPVVTESDLTIEQWYADPYQRHQPNIQAFEQWCRKNLENCLREQGLSISRTQRVLSWLVLCRTNGFRPLGSPMKRKRQKPLPDSRGTRRKISLSTSTETNDGISIDEPVFQTKDALEKEEKDLGIESDADDDGSVITSVILGPSLKPCDRGLIANTPSLPAVAKLTHGQYSNLPDEEKIQVIKERLKVFDVIYGEGQPQPDSQYWRQKLDYFSPVTNRARSVPNQGFHTQGHRPTEMVKLPASSAALYNNIIHPMGYAKLPKSALNNGLNFNQTVPHSRDVFTEDPFFGITQYSMNETENAEGLEDFNSIRRFSFRSQQAMVNDYSKTAAEIRAEEAEAAEKYVEAARKDLAVKRFDWETTDSMRGLWVDTAAGETTFNPNIFCPGRTEETWKRIQKRNQVLARGGEEADRLLEEEAEGDRREHERQKRREQHQRSKLLRLERMQDEVP